MSKIKKTILLIITIIFVLSMSTFLYAWHRYSSMYVDSNEDKHRLEHINKNPDKYKKVDGITNILLVGSDAKRDDEVAHSDAINILTIDSTNDKVMITSILRDALVEIEGHGQEKITHAYAYGGINLLRKTIEDNFDIRLENYATINFDGFKGLIDVVGGLELDIENEEQMKEINRCMLIELGSNPNISKDDIPLVTKTGIQKLNGRQVLIFSRMRHLSGGIYGRSRRHREVIEALIKKVRDTSIVQYPSLGESILPFLKTNVAFKDALSLAYTVGSMDGFNVGKLQIPTDELNEGLIVNKRIGWVNVMDLEANKTVLHDFIFDNVEYDKTQHKQFTYKGSKEQKKYNPYYGQSKPKPEINTEINTEDKDKEKKDPS